MAKFHSPAAEAIFRHFSRELDKTLQALQEASDAFDAHGIDAAVAAMEIHHATRDRERMGIPPIARPQ
jgi:hypothetical protein